MNREEALSLLNRRLDEYRRLDYEGLAARVGDEEFLEATGASGTQYQIEIQIGWDGRPGGAVRVMGAIDDGGWRAFIPISSDLVVMPDGRVEGGGE